MMMIMKSTVDATRCVLKKVSCKCVVLTLLCVADNNNNNEIATTNTSPKFVLFTAQLSKDRLELQTCLLDVYSFVPIFVGKLWVGCLC